MTKTLSIVSHKNYILSANEDFVIFLTSKSITCFTDGFTLTMKSQFIAFLFNGSEHICWIWGLEDEVHSIWVIWTKNLQECNGDLVFQNRAELATIFNWGLKILDLFWGGYLEVPNYGPRPLSTSPWKSVGEGLASTHLKEQDI